MKSAHMALENQAHIEPLASSHDTPPGPKEPSIACGSEREPLIRGPNDPIEFKQPQHANQQLNTPNPSNNGGQGTTKVGKMVEKIVERGDHGEQFQRDFVLHIISTSMIRSMNNDYFFRTLKLEKRCKDRWFLATIHWTTDVVKQRNKDEKEFCREHGGVKTIDREETLHCGYCYWILTKILDYNWDAHLLQCLNDAAVKWKQTASRYFRGPPLFYITSEILKLSLQERDAKTDGFQPQYIGQLMQLNKEIKMKKSFPKSMERVGQLIGKNIRRLYMREKLNYKGN
ncbi:hypothetical protein Cgig2_017519 [Carnegiea gigantea]|uniref:Uncharacterized protein n=1 Tax=Carnegiea gigantea TaxID=171969 RepID=A0A9Q1QC73_9CARY|nr:hypothetical protein Cgig2_017519 [Carnegiea gigantea]